MDRITQRIDYQREFIQHLHTRTVVPVMSNAFRLEAIFRDDPELHKTMKQFPEFYDDVRTIDQQLTKKWAKDIVSYPMSDEHNLARVAQYYQVVLEDTEEAKNQYLGFLGDTLLSHYQNVEGYADAVNQLRRKAPRPIFSKMVSELGLPSFSEDKEDPLLLLAQLPLPIYITTSYFGFIEGALKEAGKKPVTQFWSWSGGDSGVKVEYLPDPEYDPPVPPNKPRDFIPTLEQPVVYHLFGMENEAKTLVMSEDDYMNFLMNSAQERGNLDVIPSELLTALSGKRLLLLGYHLPDWDFRALFRFISKFRSGDPKYIPPSISIQLKPSLENKEFEEMSLSYLEKYFKEYKFNVKWLDTEQFIYELSNAWESIGKGQP